MSNAATVMLLASSGIAPPRISRISVRGRWFVDEQRRIRIFHGFNDIAASAGPVDVRRVGNFTGSNYLPLMLTSNETRLRQLIDEFGFNCFRIDAGWAAVQPAPGTIDNRYLVALRNATRLIAEHGAFSILDMHQDAPLSTRFGSYDGAPQWLINRTQPRHAFPWPYIPNGSHVDSKMSEAVGQAYGDIYHDTHGGLRAWGEAWAAFAAAFRDEASVLAYELINEPWPGDVYADPTLFLPGVAGAKSLQPAYDSVAAAIRAVDAHKIIMFEPVTWGMIYGGSGSTVARWLDSGFSHVPGGPDFANRSAFSFHYYCWLGRMGPFPGRGYLPYPPLKRALCDGKLGLGHAVFDAVEETIAHIGGASFMTEFGGIYFQPDISLPNATETIEEHWLMELADQRMQSWTFWDLTAFYDPEPTAATPRASAEPGALRESETGDERVQHRLMFFVRPYAQAIAGEPHGMHFDTTSRHFTLDFTPDPTIRAPTEIFVPPHRYPNGVSVAFEPTNASLQWAMCGAARPNTLCVTSADAESNVRTNTALRVTVRVVPKEDGGARDRN